MVRLTVLAVSSVLALSAVPVHAESPGEVLQGIGRAMNGGPYVDRDAEWRDRDRERAYRHQQHRLDAQQRDLDAQRRALHDQRRFEEDGGYGSSGYGNRYYGPSR